MVAGEGMPRCFCCQKIVLWWLITVIICQKSKSGNWDEESDSFANKEKQFDCKFKFESSMILAHSAFHSV